MFPCSGGNFFFERSYPLCIYFPPLFASRNNTFFFTTGSYLSILSGREARGRTVVRKYPVIAMEISRTAIVRDLAFFAMLFKAECEVWNTGGGQQCSCGRTNDLSE